MTSEIPIRKRRAYKKSLSGCRNCKLRRVKCDESKPECRKCSAYGVICNYLSNTPDLHVGLHGRSAKRFGSDATVHTREYKDKHPPCIIQTYLKPVIICSDGTYQFRLDGQCFAGLERFGSRAIPPFSEEVARVWRDHVPQFAFNNPYLMHTLLAVASAHERHHEMAGSTQRTLSEIYHSTRAISLFNQKLSSCLTPADYDPLWAAAVLLGILSSSAINTLPEHSWPITPPSPSDLEWFILTAGKKAVWALTNPLRPSSVFSVVAREYVAWDMPIPVSSVGSIDARLALLCGITESSSAENNPYFETAYMLTRSQALDSEFEPGLLGQQQKPKPARLERVGLVSRPQVQHLDLLKKRDKIALVLLAMWYQQCEGVCWWLDRRARTEGRAIRLFLKQHYPEDKKISELLLDPHSQKG